jgi:cytidylate kinase
VAGVGDNRAMSSRLIVTGPPGAGKSTVARALATRFDRSALVEGDAFFAFVASGAIPPWLPESQDQFARAEIDPRHVLREPPDAVDDVTDLVRQGFERGSFEHDGSA